MGKIIDIAIYIPVGHENSIRRSDLCAMLKMSDRDMRFHIKNSNTLIINVGSGYFIPNEDDGYYVKKYLKQEQARDKTHKKTVDKARQWLNSRKENADLVPGQMRLEEIMEM